LFYTTTNSDRFNKFFGLSVHTNRPS
jgi:hypothetical protein